MDEQSFIKNITELKDTAIFQGGYITRAQIEEVFGELNASQEKVLTQYFKENNIGIGEALEAEDTLSEEDLDHINLYLEEIEGLDAVDDDMKRVLIMSAMNGDNVAKDKLAASYLKSVADLARLYSGQGVDIADLIGEGNVALTAAMNMLGSLEDPSECDALVTRTAMNAMEELVGYEKEETEALEHTMAKIMNVLNKAREMNEELNRKISAAEICAEMDIDEEELGRLMMLSKDIADYVAL
jgi:RNA polymerase primary sigma factor